MVTNARQQLVMVVDALTTTDNFAIPLWSEHIHTERQVGPLRVILHIKGLDRGGIAVDDHWLVELA